jgi:hypothetical protein
MSEHTSAGVHGGESLSGLTIPGLKAGRISAESVNVTSSKDATRVTAIEAFETHHVHKASRFDKLARKVVAWVEKHFVCGCGMDENYIRDLEEEEAFQQEVTRVRVTPNMESGDSLTHAYRSVVESRDDVQSRTSSSMSSGSETGSIIFGDVEVAYEGAVPRGCAYNEYVLPRVSARVVGAVVSVLDAKLGVTLEHTKENRLVVERRARLVMSHANFRNADISLHLGHVVECYFQSREFLEKAGGRRRRAKPWLLKLLGFKDAAVGRV